MRVVHHRLQPVCGIEIVPPQSSKAKLFFENRKDKPEDSFFILVSDPRTKQLKFPAMFQVVCDTMGTKCVLLEWIAEGGRNQLYLAHLANGLQVAVRVTFPYSYGVMFGPEFASQDTLDWNQNTTRMKSEIQTMIYLKRNTDIPIPAILRENISESPIGAPFTIQELVGGTTVTDRWAIMSRTQKTAVVQKLGKVAGTLYSLEFNSFGSIVDGEKGTIGSIVNPPCALHHPYPPQGTVGPWPKDDPYGFFAASAAREYNWLRSDLGKKVFFARYIDTINCPGDKAEEAWATRVAIHKDLVSLIPHLSSLYPLPPLACRPTISHPDFHFSNALVSDDDPSSVTGVIDWEYTAILPLWHAYSMLQDIEYMGDQIYINNPSLSKEEEDMLRKEYVISIAQMFPDMIQFFSDEPTQRKVKALRFITTIASDGTVASSPLSMIKPMLENARREVDEADTSGIAILDGIIEALSD